jgi:3-methyl-2-oxobutanoate hydroxymethyltransferase
LPTATLQSTGIFAYNGGMPDPAEKVTLKNLQEARQGGPRFPILTCYDYTTLPASLAFMIEITAAVRRGAPLAFVIADMPFGSYQASTAQGVRNVCKMIQRTNCDCVKLEMGESNLSLLRRLADSGIAVMAHLGLRPQSVGLIGGYKARGRTAAQAMQIIDLARRAQEAGAVSILLEAVPPAVARAVIENTSVPVVGCGAGQDCHGCVIVTQDALGFSDRKPRFVPDLCDLASGLHSACVSYVKQVLDQEYPAPAHSYSMAPGEEVLLDRQLRLAKAPDLNLAGRTRLAK